STRVSSKGTSVGRLPRRIFLSLKLSSLRRLYIIEKRHEPVVHVQLLVAVEKREPRIIGNKVYFGFLVSASHHNIFQDSSRWLSGQARQLKAMAMEMDWMDIVTGIA